MELSSLPRDMVKEILSKLPVTSQRAMRLTCKNLNTSFDEKKHISDEEPMVMMVMNDKVYLIDINLHGTWVRNIVDPSINRESKLISLNVLDDHVPDISQIFHCDGLLLCITENKKLMVWNPYSAETKWIEPRYSYDISDHYAIGYENRSCRINKILRFSYGYDTISFRCEIYYLETNSWIVPAITPPKSYIYPCSVSLKGNTYWLATERSFGGIYFLICFDFTRERFGPHLHLPRQYPIGANVALSSVREEQLVLLLILRMYTCAVEIWVTSHIEPKTVSWNKLFLQMDMTPFIGYRRLQISVGGIGFFIDEEKKIAVIMAKNEDYTRHIACIIGENGYFRQVDLGEVRDSSCMSYFVHIKKPKRKQIRRSYREFLPHNLHLWREWIH